MPSFFHLMRKEIETMGANCFLEFGAWGANSFKSLMHNYQADQSK